MLFVFELRHLCSVLHLNNVSILYVHRVRPFPCLFLTSIASPLGLSPSLLYRFRDFSRMHQGKQQDVLRYRLRQ